MCSHSSCVNDFIAGRKCIHGFKLCKSCNEIWLCDAYTADGCPRHQTYEGEIKPDMEEIQQRALSTIKPYNFDDTKCDEVCWHGFDILKYFHCRHGMAKCEYCGVIWDGCAQCTCFIRDGYYDYGYGDSDVQPDSTVSES